MGPSPTKPWAGFISRWSPHRLLAAATGLFAILGVALVDYQLTSARLPLLVPGYFGSSPERTELHELQSGYADRAWLYSLLTVAAIAVLVFVTVRSTAEARRRALFTDLGVLAVLSGLAATAITLQDPRLLEHSSKLVIWMPTLLMLAVAGLGTVLNAEAGADTAAGETAFASADPRRPLTRLGRNAIGISAIAIVLLAIGSSDVECSSQASGISSASGISGTLLIAALVLSTFVGVIGLAALFFRRWFLALMSILFPVLILFGIANAISPCLG